MTGSLPLPDGDAGWQVVTGTVRVRFHPLGSLQLQVSSPRGDGTYDTSTFVLDGSLRDVRNSGTQFPTYGAPSVEEYPTAGDHLAADVLAAQSKRHITSPPPVLPPVSGS